MNCENNYDNHKNNEINDEHIADCHTRNTNDCEMVTVNGGENRDYNIYMDDDKPSVLTVEYEVKDVHESAITTKDSSQPKTWHSKEEKGRLKHTTPKSTIFMSSEVDRNKILEGLWTSCRQVLGLKECSLFVQLKQQGKILYGGSADMIEQFKCGGIACVTSSEELKLEPLNESDSRNQQESCHICPIGPKTFSTLGSLNRHLQRVHSINTKNAKDNMVVSHLNESNSRDQQESCHICPIGPKTFSTLGSLNRHQQRVHSINTKNAKDNMVVSHLNESNSRNQQENGRTHPLSCHICPIGPRTFSSLGTLNRHLRHAHSINTKNAKDNMVVSHLNSTEVDNNTVKDEASENGDLETDFFCNELSENRNDSETLETLMKPRKSKLTSIINLNDHKSDNNSSVSVDNQISDIENQSNPFKHEHKNISQNTESKTQTLNTQVETPDVVSQNSKTENPDSASVSQPSTLSGKKKKRNNVGTTKEPKPKKKTKDKGATHMCEECGYVAKCNSLLKRHQLIHKGENPYKTGMTYKCELCDYVADRPALLKRHSSCHFDERPFLCKTCGSTFRLSYHLRRHELIHFKDPDVKYECKICNKILSRKEHLVRHISTHSDNKPFACSVCPKTFARNDYLRAHMRYHTGDRPHQCSLCGRCYVTKKEREKHEERCRNSDPVSFVTCRECNKTFRSIAALQRHEEKHREEHTQGVFNSTQVDINSTRVVFNLRNSETCTICHEQFTDADQLRIHMKLHLDLNPISLDKIIPMESTSPQPVHEPSPILDTAENVVMFKCGICDGVFTDSMSLSSHVQSHDVYTSQSKDIYTLHKDDSIASKKLYTLH